ncbi:MAG TPA: VC0807 family protein [Nocardioides sp.]|nr:VC0807 family protein [Nocardioides sp.]
MSASATCVEPALERPRLVTIVRRVSLSLLIACVAPATMFYVCMVLTDVWTAILAALAWTYGAIAWRALTGRRTSGLLILVAIIMTCRTIVSLILDSAFLYFLQPIISDGVVATLFLLSLASSRPLVARLAADFYPMDIELSARPRVRRLFWRLTLLWATLGLIKAGAALWLLQSVSLETFVLLKSLMVLTLTGLAVVATITASAIVARKEGLMGPNRLVPALL